LFVIKRQDRRSLVLSARARPY